MKKHLKVKRIEGLVNLTTLVTSKDLKNTCKYKLVNRS